MFMFTNEAAYAQTKRYFVLDSFDFAKPHVLIITAHNCFFVLLNIRPEMIKEHRDAIGHFLISTNYATFIYVNDLDVRNAKLILHSNGMPIPTGTMRCERIGDKEDEIVMFNAFKIRDDKVLAKAMMDAINQVRPYDDMTLSNFSKRLTSLDELLLLEPCIPGRLKRN